MKLLRTTVMVVVISIAINSCTTSVKEKQVKAIKNLEKELFSAQTLDKQKGFHMIDTYVNFSKQYPEDTASAVYLFKAAEISMNLQLGSQSIYYYDKILSNFPNFYKAPECLFLKAFIYENQMGNLDRAKEFYTLFLTEYPNHPLAKDAKASIKYLGKSPEELVKMFQEMNETNK